MNRILIITVFSILLASWTLTNKFPKINYTTTHGKSITNEYFNDTTTIVVHFFIGCPGAMILVKDLQILEAEGELNSQVLLIAENTDDQILQFNSDEKNMWSRIRKYFGVGIITNDIVGECEKGKVEVINGDTIVGSQCKKLSKKLNIESSPTTYRINGKGEITGSFEGYASSSNVAYFEKKWRELK